MYRSSLPLLTAYRRLTHGLTRWLCNSYQYSDYATDWTIGVRFLSEARICSPRHRVQTGSGAHSAFHPIGTRTVSLGVKWGWEVKRTTHLHILPRLRIPGAVPSLPRHVFMAWCLVTYRLLFHGLVLS